MTVVIPARGACRSVWPDGPGWLRLDDRLWVAAPADLVAPPAPGVTGLDPMTLRLTGPRGGDGALHLLTLAETVIHRALSAARGTGAEPLSPVPPDPGRLPVLAPLGPARGRPARRARDAELARVAAALPGTPVSDAPEGGDPRLALVALRLAHLDWPADVVLTVEDGPALTARIATAVPVVAGAIRLIRTPTALALRPADRAEADTALAALAFAWLCRIARAAEPALAPAPLTVRLVLDDPATPEVFVMHLAAQGWGLPLAVTAQRGALSDLPLPDGISFTATAD